MRQFLLLFFALVLICQPSQAQRKKQTTPTKHYLEDVSLSGLKFRNIGPSVTSGRISDFAVNPANPSEYYVATSSGGVWKTTNAGNTYQPLFDSQGSYSIGVVTMDPNNPNVIWVGTGENNNQRSAAYGDGVYKSEDGGASWKKVGLENSEHIGKIIVHPDNSNVVYVAAIGPLWSAGGDRGVYKTTDGGETWSQILSVDEHTGINDLEMDPRNPDVLYASSFQRRRHVFTYISGGPGSGIHKSLDGGATWQKAQKGLPDVDLGRIDIEISPADPEKIYAIVEAAQGKGGFYRSTNRGASWEKRSGHTTSGNYYVEIFADPVDPDRVYSMDTWMRVTYDGGKSFTVVGEDYKHVDNHVIWINPANTDHLLVGCDGGIYESWDRGAHWDFKENLPVTQFYKVAVDNDAPFYNVYGGTQDNFSLGGPSRTISGNGISNDQWFITHGGDGFESQVDPDNPDIVYAQSQYGVLVRYDRKSGEEKGIQPKERKGENSYRWNWDAPLAVSAHKPGRLYFAANKVFRSDDRGNSWDVISEDLTRQINRNELKVMGRVWSVDAVAKNGGVSPYGTIVAFSESPLNENLLVVGTDDGLIQITEDGGDSWRSVGSFSGVPARTYVNAVWASQHDENLIYAAFNNHKNGDFKPYVYVSRDKGASWTGITSNLPEKGSTYALAEDHVDSQLLFVGTEYGVFFSNNGGSNWNQLKAGVPTIAIRDLAIQKRENDLVMASFGRGFFVLDDYSALRSMSNDNVNAAGKIYPVRDAMVFERSMPYGLPRQSFQGDNFYLGDNLGASALITFSVGEEMSTAKKDRLKREKERSESGGDNAYPSYEALTAEQMEAEPYLLFTINDANGNVVRKLTTSPSKGLNRLTWDLRYASKEPVSLTPPPFYNPFGGTSEGTLVPPGTYNVTLTKVIDGVVELLDGPVEFKVVPIDNTVLPAADRSALAAFQAQVNELSGKVSATAQGMNELNNQMKHIKEAMNMAATDQAEMSHVYEVISTKSYELRARLLGDRVASRLDLGRPPSVANRVGFLVYEQGN
ncbi:MAG: glycosyl hydrolase, partial [Bacteroidota bacterium]